MKLSRLLVLSALWLVGLGANAANLIERTAPQKPATALYDQEAQENVNKTAAAYAVNHCYLLYNTGAQMFFCAGNDWNTRASISNDAAVVYFAPTSAAQEKGIDVVELKNYVPVQSDFHSAFAGGSADFWTDNDGRADRFWKVTDMGNNTYRISNVVNETDKFVGWQGYESDTRLYLLAADAEGASLDWQLFEVNEWTEYFAQDAIYQKAIELKQLIESAEPQGVNVDSYVAVYNNMNATLAQIEQAIESLQKAIEENMVNGTVDKPTDATSFITNPSFDNDNWDGWSGDAWGHNGALSNAEHYENTYNTYQDLTGLMNGVYALGVKAFYRAGYAEPALANYLAANDESRYAKLYAKAGDNELQTSIVSPFVGCPNKATGVGSESPVSSNGITYVIPNNMIAAEHYMHELGLYDNRVFVGVEDGKMTVGVKKNTKITGDWTIFDDFTLTYYGNAVASFQYWYDQSLAALPDYTATTDVYTQQYMDAYTAAIAPLKNVKVTNTAETVAAIAAAEATAAEAAVPLLENISLWKQYQQLAARCAALVNDDHIKPIYKDQLGDYADLERTLRQRSLTNEQLKTAIEEMQAIITKAETDPISGGDVTYLLQNPNFEKGTEGWTGFGQDDRGNKQNHPTTGGASDNKLAEAYMARFDLYQIVKSAPAGLYEIGLNAFYRDGANDDAYKEYVNASGNISCPIEVYLNNSANPIANVYDVQIPDSTLFNLTSGHLYGPSPWEEPNKKYWFANGMSTAGDAFSCKEDVEGAVDGQGNPISVTDADGNIRGYYYKQAYGLVREGEELRVGIRRTSDVGDAQWAIWDNFQLTFYGDDADKALEALNQLFDRALMLEDEEMGSDVREQLEDVLNRAEALLESTDGQAILAVLGELNDMFNTVSESKAILLDLEGRLSKLQDAFNDADDDHSALADQAEELYNKVADLKAGGKLTNAEALDYIKQINELILKLRLPVNYNDANSNAPIDVTMLITNPSYDLNTNTGWSGTSPAFQTFTNAEVYDANFDSYQDIIVPAGNFQLGVSAFYRAGSAAGDYKAYKQNPDSLNYGIVYAVVNGDTTFVTMPRLAKEAVALKSVVEADSTGKYTVPGGWVLCDTSDSIIVVNNMEQAENQFKEDKYRTSFEIQVPAEPGTAMNTVRIGLKKTVNISYNWAIWDNWTLHFFGQGHAPEAIADVTDSQTVKVEYYNLNGMKTSANERGIVLMKQTMANGQVVVKKILK